VASSLTDTSATFAATVNPDGEAVSDCRFEYGISTLYGSSAACSSLPAAGTSPVEVAAGVEGLSPETTYHFRIVATNAAGTGYGPDLTLMTPGLRPTVTRLSATMGPAAGGQVVIVTGTNFSEATAVDFGASAASFTVGSGNSITAVTPAETPGRVYVTVTAPGGTSATRAHDRYTFTAP